MSKETRSMLAALQAKSDPIALLAKMRTCQQQLIDITASDHPVAGADTDAKLEEFLAGLKDAWQEGIFRSLAKPLRTYRTRVDPFEAIVSHRVV